MAQYNIKPGTFEAITNVSIGSFTQNVVTNFKLDGFYAFLLSDVVIKSGATVISSSNYTLSIDTNATTQESGQSAKTLYGAIKITNPTYAGVELNVSGNNFGTYTNNQANVDSLTAGLLTKTSPTGTDINAGEVVEFAGTGSDIKSSNSGSIAQYDSGSLYSTAGTLVRLEGITYSATGEAGNQGIDPSDPNNALYWYEPEDARTLKRYANGGKVIDGTMHTIHDRTSGNYTTSIKVNKTKVGGVDKEFFELHLDGSQVTGNATLEALLTDYAYIDLFAPEVLGTRTLIDMGGRTTRSQSVSGQADTLAEIQEDAMQRITGSSGDRIANSQSGSPIGTESGVFVRSNANQELSNISGGTYYGSQLNFDSANSTLPNPAKTNDEETRMANIVVGCSSVIIMK